MLNSLEPAGARKFPLNLLRFIESRQTELFDRFVALFSEALTAESVAHRQRFVEGDREQEGSLRYRILEGLHALCRERESLRKKVRTLHDRIRRKEEDPVRDQNYEKELRDLKLEKAALQALIGRINARDTLNFFTDEGLLPNYVFPEAGVLLRSVIYRRRELPEEGEGHDQPQIYEYERPAVNAIDELAPANHIYAGGRKVRWTRWTCVSVLIPEASLLLVDTVLPLET